MAVVIVLYSCLRPGRHLGFKWKVESQSHLALDKRHQRECRIQALHPNECRSSSNEGTSTSGRKEDLLGPKQKITQRPVTRCALCYEPDFNNLTQLAEHLLGRRHTDLFPKRHSTAACPYCGDALRRDVFYKHIQNNQCGRAGCISIPESQRRTLSQADLDRDPKFTSIIEERVPSGVLRIRPLHTQHTFEASLVVTDAFRIDQNPPRFGWMLAELRRQAMHYADNASPVVHQTVNFPAKIKSREVPSVDDVVHESGGGSIMDLFSLGPSAGERRDLQRREAEAAWGVWLWLVADLTPDDRSLLPEGQDSVVVGATAMLFHDRAASLQRIPLLSTPLTTADLDYSLWLAPFPPPDLEHNRCVFVWWTSTDSNFRRQGVAGLLLRGCEAIGASAGFWSFYIQAALRQRDGSNMLGAWITRDYEAAVRAYRKAGYAEYDPGEEVGSLYSRSRRDTRTAVLMSKSF